jgi:hypothetical protein
MKAGHWFAVAAVIPAAMVAASAPPNVPLPPTAFDPATDFISLHYDHAPDKDDGQSAAADYTMLESLFGDEWVVAHTAAVSGACGLNANLFNPDSNAVMDAVWRFLDTGNSYWLPNHTRHATVLNFLTVRWRLVLLGGGDVWVKEGGQSDLTAEVIANIRQLMPSLPTEQRIHVIQHSLWNEQQTTPAALAYVMQHSDYIKIPDANAYLNVLGGDPAFEAAALAHPVFGSVWQAAFDYYDPNVRLDFSDTGELMHMLGFGQMSIDQFRVRFLQAPGHITGGLAH